jgi:hypothetical protein
MTPPDARLPGYLLAEGKRFLQASKTPRLNNKMGKGIVSSCCPFLSSARYQCFDFRLDNQIKRQRLCRFKAKWQLCTSRHFSDEDVFVAQLLFGAEISLDALIYWANSM